MSLIGNLGKQVPVAPIKETCFMNLCRSWIILDQLKQEYSVALLVPMSIIKT